MADPEPVSDTAVQPATGYQWRRHEPFTPYDIGPYNLGPSAGTSSKPHWAYEDLAPAERDVVDRGRDTTRWSSINAAYASAMTRRANLAIANSAQSQLGVDNLGAIGVVP